MTEMKDERDGAKKTKREPGSFSGEQASRGHDWDIAMEKSPNTCHQLLAVLPVRQDSAIAICRSKGNKRASRARSRSRRNTKREGEQAEAQKKKETLVICCASASFSQQHSLHLRRLTLLSQPFHFLTHLYLRSVVQSPKHSQTHACLSRLHVAVNYYTKPQVLAVDLSSAQKVLVSARDGLSSQPRYYTPRQAVRPGFLGGFWRKTRREG